MPPRRFTIDPRPASLGGCWQLRLRTLAGRRRDRNGWRRLSAEEGINSDDAYADALQAGDNWLMAFSESEA